MRGPSVDSRAATDGCGLNRSSPSRFGAISGPNARTTLLLFSYAAGAATSLAVAILAGGRVFATLKKSLGAGEWLRRGLGAAVLLAVIAIALGWDSSILTRWSLAGTNRLEQSLIDGIKPIPSPKDTAMSNAMSRSEGVREICRP